MVWVRLRCNIKTLIGVACRSHKRPAQSSSPWNFLWLLQQTMVCACSPNHYLILVGRASTHVNGLGSINKLWFVMNSTASEYAGREPTSHPKPWFRIARQPSLWLQLHREGTVYKYSFQCCVIVYYKPLIWNIEQGHEQENNWSLADSISYLFCRCLSSIAFCHQDFVCFLFLKTIHTLSENPLW